MEEPTDEVVAAEWAEMARIIDLTTHRIETPNEFVVEPNSELAADDAASAPYQVSHSARWCLNSGVDHLHALKSLVVKFRHLHSAAPYSLVRGALENFAAGFWILHPRDPVVRVEHGLQWWLKNGKDRDNAVPRDLETQQRARDAIVEVGRAAGCDKQQLASRYTSTKVLEYADQYSAAKRPHLVWQICSGFAHGRPWAHFAMNEMENHPSYEEGSSQARFTTDDRRLLLVTSPAFELMGDLVRLIEVRSAA